MGSKRSTLGKELVRWASSSQGDWTLDDSTEVDMNTYAQIQKLIALAEGFEVQGLIDQDERTPHVLFAVADILVKWYAAIPGYDVVGNQEDMLEDLRTAMSDTLANNETKMRVSELQVRRALGHTENMTTAELVEAIMNVSGPDAELMDEHVVAWAESHRN